MNTIKLKRIFIKKINLLISSVLISFLTLSGIIVNAQVRTEKITHDEIVKRPYYFMAIQAELLIMPKVDVKELIEEDIILDHLPLPYRFGKKIYTDIDMDNSGTWYNLKNGNRLWALRILSKGATSINLIFDEFYLARNTEFNIYNIDGTVISGPYTSSLNNPQQMIGTDLIDGDEIIIEYFEPKDAIGLSNLHINTVVHGYREIILNTKDGGFIDVNCPEGDGWQKESDAIVRIVIGNTFCTGTLINNTESDREPYILTASHCLTNNFPILNYEFTQQEKDAVATWIFNFQYRNISCNGTNESDRRTYAGAEFKAAWTHTDFALVELNQTPTHNGVTYAGWSRYTSNVISTIDIQHPQHLPQKISIDHQTPVFGKFLDRPDDYYWVTTWDAGNTSSGSSGSALFKQNKQIIGQLSYGDGITDYFGRFDISWDGPAPFDAEKSLKHWLDPNNRNYMSINSICNSPLNASIIGVSLICNSSYNFKLNNAPLGREISWITNPPNLLTPSSYSGDTIFSVQPVSEDINGAVTISASFNDYCNNNLKTYSKNVWIGKPANVEIHVPVEPIYGETDAMVWVSSDPGNETYDWQLSGGTIVENNGEEIILNADCPSRRGLIIRVKAINNCGETDWISRHVDVDCSGGINPLSIIPNPSDNYFELDVSKYYNESSFSGNNEYEVKIFNALNILLFDQKSSSQMLRINTSDFKEGIYVVYVIIGEKVLVEQLVISH